MVASARRGRVDPLSLGEPGTKADVGRMIARGSAESQTIGICRVLCIFFMMNVHIDPGPVESSIVHGGAFSWVGAVWIDFLGRTSVAALSLISGYLLVRNGAAHGFPDFARRRFVALILPMLTWNLLYCFAVVLVAAIEGKPVPREFTSTLSAVSSLTGLAGPTENLSLFFLRDIFVASLVAYGIQPLLRRFPLPVLGLVALLAVFELTEPVIFRPSILLFVCLGVVAAQRVDSLSDLVLPRRLVPCLLAVGAALFLCHVTGLGARGFGVAIEDILRRLLLSAGVITLATQLAETWAGARIVPFEERIFETYLMHAALFHAVWAIWRRTIGGAAGPSYLVFFLLAPVVAVVAGQAVGAVTDHLAPPLRIALRGHARLATPPRAATRASAPGVRRP